MTLVGLTLTAAVKGRALELGFDRVAVGPADPPEHADAFARWLDAGHAGTMAYLARTRAERLDPARLLSGARSLVAVALVYKPAEPAGDEGATGDTWRGVARYARGRDYHDVMRPRLERLAAFIGEATGAAARSRAAVDTSAVLERDLAARAGLGWIGKNTNLLAEDLGSYFFIGIVLTTAELGFDDRVPDRCGTCEACLTACPTAAFTGPHVLDARRCVSYLTIEHRGEIDPSLRPGIGEWLFGCDVCQDVCPWNRKSPSSRVPDFAPPRPLDSPRALLGLDELEFRERFRGSALRRTKRSGLVRNAAIVLGNTRDDGAAPALRQAAGDPDATVRSAAAWALARLGGS